MSDQLQFPPSFPKLERTDLVLISKEGTAFGVRRCALEEHSSVFLGMLAVPTQPDASEVPKINLDEKIDVIECFLELACGRDSRLMNDDVLPAELILDLLAATDKYDMPLLLKFRIRLTAKPSWTEALKFYLGFHLNKDNVGIQIASRAVFASFSQNNTFEVAVYRQERFFDEIALLRLTILFRRARNARSDIQSHGYGGYDPNPAWTKDEFEGAMGTMLSGTWKEHVDAYSKDPKKFTYVNSLKRMSQHIDLASRI
ncbi:hypothetical protein BT69DRAFT_1329888 [Atractiella rhizophila]|nr:hypothetical protein BT69DRAFT_1329888 [Atractiella rhizophila]